MSLKKRDAAYELYKSGWTHQQIADLLGVASRTIDNWKRKPDAAGLTWDERRRKETLREVNTTDMVWELYQWNLEVLTRRVEAWREEGADEMITKGDVDALQKFYVQVKDKSIVWNVYVRIARELKAYIMQEDVDLAKRIEDSHLIDDFLNTKRGEQ